MALAIVEDLNTISGRHGIGDSPPGSSKGAKSKTGQGMVEFALTLPVLMLLMLGIIQFGRLLFTYSAVTTAAREAARYGSPAGGLESTINSYQDCDGIRAAAERIGGLAGVENSAAGVAIAYDSGPGGPAISGGCPVGSIGPELRLGDHIIVTVTTTYQPIVPLVNLPDDISIRSVSRRTVLVDLELQ
jgi:Flp pilus assembly protein TadG